MRDGNGYLYDVETWSLSLLLDGLQFDKGSQKKFSAQLSRLNMVQRSPDRKIVALYEMRDTYFKSWEKIKLEDKRANLEAFRIRFKLEQESPKTLTLSVWFHEGRISSIEYPKNYEFIDGRNRLYLSEVNWDDVRCPNGLSLISQELFLT